VIKERGGYRNGNPDEEEAGLLHEGGPVVHPKHYNSLSAKCLGCGRPIECIDVIEHMPLNIGTAVKYLWRVGLKDKAIQELQKAKWYIERQIEKLKREMAE
jgi:hypothetical protein